MKKLSYVVGSALFAFTVNAFAVDAAVGTVQVGTAAEAQTMSEAAAKEVDKDQAAAFTAFKDKAGAYQKKDLYVFCMDMDGKMLLHPKKPELENTNMKGFDKYGDKLFENMIKVASSAGKGWVSYKWPYPGTDALKAKKSYIIKNSKGFFCGVGAYAE